MHKGNKGIDDDDGSLILLLIVDVCLDGNLRLETLILAKKPATAKTRDTRREACTSLGDTG